MYTVVLAYIGGAFMEYELFQMVMPREDLFILAQLSHILTCNKKHKNYFMALRPKIELATLSSVDLAYMAAFLDGDGSIMARIIAREDYVLKFQIYLSVNFIQSTRRRFLLENFQKSLGGKGIVRDRGDGNSEYVLNGFALVGPFLTRILPFLRLKGKQANLVLKIIEQYPLVQNDPQKFVNLCYLADQVAASNDSRNRILTSAIVLQKYAEIFPNIQFVGPTGGQLPTTLIDSSYEE
jgi:hypothetical protein